MKSNTKLVWGIVDIVLVFIASAMGFWLLNSAEYDYTLRLIFGFFLTFSFVFTVLTVINLYKKK